MSKSEDYLVTSAPDDNLNYAVQRPGLSEYTAENAPSSNGMNRGYGVCKNLYLTSTAGMAQGIDARTINAKEYTYFNTENNLVASGSSSLAVLFLNTEALS